MGICPRDTVIVEITEGELRMHSLPSAIRRVQARMWELNPDGTASPDELIANHRVEMAHE